MKLIDKQPRRIMMEVDPKHKNGGYCCWHKDIGWERKTLRFYEAESMAALAQSSLEIAKKKFEKFARDGWEVRKVKIVRM